MITLKFDNESDRPINIYWHDYEGHKVNYGIIGPGESREQVTFVTHPWSATASDGTELTIGG